ncbi:tumor necrosis factor receptor superfamily member 11A-like [Saccoglossus kowalevskii]
MIAVAARNSSEDNKCKCIKGYHYSQSREACIKNLYCPPGEGIKKSTGECVVCEAGTYSDINSNTQKCKQQPK